MFFFVSKQMNKVENNQLANFYHSNTLIFIRRNVIYVFTFHNPFEYFDYTISVGFRNISRITYTLQNAYSLNSIEIFWYV